MDILIGILILILGGLVGGGLALYDWWIETREKREYIRKYKGEGCEHEYK